MIVYCKMMTRSGVAEKYHIGEMKQAHVFVGFSAPCDTLWPSLNTSPLVRDADSDGFVEIVYAVNYAHVVQNARTMKVRKFSLKVDAEK